MRALLPQEIVRKWTLHADNLGQNHLKRICEDANLPCCKETLMAAAVAARLAATCNSSRCNIKRSCNSLHLSWKGILQQLTVAAGDPATEAGFLHQQFLLQLTSQLGAEIPPELTAPKPTEANPWRTPLQSRGNTHAAKRSKPEKQIRGANRPTPKKHTEANRPKPERNKQRSAILTHFAFELHAIRNQKPGPRKPRRVF